MKRTPAILSASHDGQVIGRRLKFDATDPNQGIFFINGSESRVEIVGKNKGTELMFSSSSLILIPASMP
ncbi:DUF4469 domain-containing protein [Candidatus Kaiserbacteria bacterium]|nr:DUF4469 domain-containing protein [Candidatus Kaiserbacteria bacterium]